VPLSSTSIVSNDKMNIFTQNEQLNIISSEEIKSVTIFDVLGKNIYSKENINENSFTVSQFLNKNQALIVKIVLSNGQTVEKKVIF